MSMIDHSLPSFIRTAAYSDFSIHDLAYAIFSHTEDGACRTGIAIKECALNLSVLDTQGLLSLDNLLHLT